MAEPVPEVATSWADPGYFAHRSRLKNGVRVLAQMIKPPRGHRTIPTKSGMMLILLSMGIGSAAYNTASNILFMVLALLLSALLLSGLLSWLNFQGTKWRLVCEQHFRAGEITPVKIEITNTKKLLPTMALWFLVRAKNSERTARIPLEESISPKSNGSLQWLFEPQKRGIEIVEITGMESLFPFGFLRKIISEQGQKSQKHEVTVWPKRVEYQFATPVIARSRSIGRTANLTGSGSELLNVREYRQGDPLRHVHWKATARMQRPMVREVADEQQEAFVIWVDAPAQIWQEGQQFETLCSVAASLAEDLFRKEKLHGYAVGDGPLTPVKRAADLHGLMDALARFSPAPKASIPPATNQLPIISFSPSSMQRVDIHVDNIPAGSA